MREPPPDAPDEEWLVWADHMQQLGDPRGELIALAAHPARQDAFVRKHADALLGRTLGRHARKGRVRITRWRRYTPDALELRIDDAAEGPQLVVDLVNSPVAATLRGLGVVGVASPYGEGLDLTATIGWLRESRLPPELTSFALVDDRARAVDHLVSRNIWPGPNLVRFGSLYELWLALADIQHVAVVVADAGQVQLRPLRFPALRSFTLHALCWADGLGQLLANASWPLLSSLELRLCEGEVVNWPDDSRAYAHVYNDGRQRGSGGGEPMAADWNVELGPLFDALGELPLRRLALTSFRNAHAILDLIAEANLSLTELDLSDSAFGVEHAERLVRMPFARDLKKLVVERVALPSPKPLAELPAEIIHSHAPRTPTYRYIVGME